MTEILDILVILDRSGSMQTGKADHEGGLRSFVRDQKTLDGDVRFTLCQFDSTNPCEVVYDRVPIADVDEDKIVLIPRGGTPLFGAIGQALAHLEQRQAQARADQTIVMVITDGEDTGGNGEWDKAKVESRAKAMEKQGASFLYLAADLDAFSEASKMLGATAVQTMTATYSPATAGSVNAVYGTISNKVAGVRKLRASGMARSASATALNFVKSDYDNISSGSAVAFDAGAQAIADTVTSTTTSGTKE